MEKFGLIYEGICDHSMYGLVKEDYRELKKSAYLGYTITQACKDAYYEKYKEMRI